MFLKHFQLRTDPFAVAPDPAFFYAGPEHREALASLYYVIAQRRGCGLMAGASGMGKTLVLNCLCERISSLADVVLLHAPMSGAEMIDSLAESLGIPESSSSYREVRAIEHRLAKKRGRRTVLMVDCAELLCCDAIEALQTLVALETREGKLLDVLIAAQLPFVDALQAPRFDRLRQSIDVSCRLVPLDEARTAEYLWHRAIKAGSKRNLFTRPAAALLASATRGIPRRINQLAHQTLALAWSREASFVDEDIVWGVLYDLPVPELVEWGHELSESSSKELVVTHA